MSNRRGGEKVKLSFSKDLLDLAMVGLSLAMLFLVNGCTPMSQVPATGGEVRDKMLMGKITKEELLKQCPAFQEGVARYVPKAAAVEGLRKVDKKSEILVFLGTWCPDSISEVPKFIKVCDTVNNPNLSVQLIGVDRAKQDGLGLSRKFGVERVPTFIFLRDGKELGRIVEYPQKEIEEDTLGILTKSP
jgi:thiol-disulfide isomerase/thioredoxin